MILAAIALLVAALSAGLWWKARRRPAPGLYERLALALNEAPGAEACDRAGAERRLRFGRLLDHLHPRIRSLWRARESGDFPSQKMEAVGPVFFRVAAPAAPAPEGFDVNAFSWEEAQGTLSRTQINPDAPETKERWRDLDTMLLYLFQKDGARLLKGKRYLPPGLTEHTFRTNPHVKRTGARELTVTLAAGDFTGAEAKLAKILEAAWSTGGNRLRVRFANTPGLYRLQANFGSSRSYVDHRSRTLVIANYAYARTVAHELGHVLGFDDHYYNVWHGEYCYYTQEARVADLMSSSERGRVSAAHWRLLDQAYPRKEAARGRPFAYIFAPPLKVRAAR